MTKWTKEYRREVREKRKAEGRCIDCTALMLPEWPKLVYCPMCKETRDITAKRYRTSKKGLRATRRRNRERRADPVKRAREWARSAARLFQRKIDGICRQCKEPSLEDSLYCAFHRERVNLASREYQRRKAARARGVIIPAPKRERAKVVRFKRPPQASDRVEIVSSTPVEDYLRGDMDVAKASVRYAELCNGITVREIGDAFGADHPMRDSITHAVSRALKSGRLVTGGPGDVEGITGDRLIYPNRKHRRAA